MAIKVLQGTEYAVSHSDAIKMRGRNKTLTGMFPDEEISVVSNEEFFFLSGFMIGSDGNVVSGSSYKVSRLIDLTDVVSISATLVQSYSSQPKGIAFYGADAQPVNNGVLNRGGTVELTASDFPAGAKYVRFNFLKASAAVVTVTSFKNPIDDVPELKDCVLATKDIRLSDDAGLFVDGYVISNNGTVTGNASYKVTNLISTDDAIGFKVTDVFVATGIKGIGLYDDEGEPLEGHEVLIYGANPGIDVNLNVAELFGAKYIRFCFSKSKSPTILKTVKESINEKIDELADSIDNVLYQTEDVTLGASDYLEGNKIGSLNGNLVADAANKVSRVIDLKSVVSIDVTNMFSDANARSYAYYDEGMGYLTDTRLTGNKTLLASEFPSSARYIRFCYNATGETSTVIHKKIDLMDEAGTVQMVEVRYGDDKFTSEYYVADAGNLLANNTYKGSYPIDITKAQLVKIHVNKNCAFYDKDFNLVGSVIPIGTAKYIKHEDFPAGAVYLVCSAYATITWNEVLVYYEKWDVPSELVEKELATQAGGYINTSTGELVEGQGWRNILAYPVLSYKMLIGLDFTAVSPNSFGISFARFVFYDSEGKFISSSAGKVVCAVPDNACYVSMTSSSEHVRVIFGGYDESVEKIGTSVVGKVKDLAEHHLADNQLKGKKVAFLGDSITSAQTYGGTYPKEFGRLTGSIISNFGQNGAVFGKLANTVHIADEADNLTGDEDLVSVFAGTNDFGKNVPIGDYYSIDPVTGMKSAPSTTDTLAYGVHEVINKIRTTCPNAKIVFMTPTPRKESPGVSTTKPSKYSSREKNGVIPQGGTSRNGYYIQDYTACIKDICAFYSIPVLDLLSISQLDLNEPNYARYDKSDGLHPEVIAHYEIARLLVRFVNNNIVIL